MLVMLGEQSDSDLDLAGLLDIAWSSLLFRRKSVSTHLYKWCANNYCCVVSRALLRKALITQADTQIFQL